MKKEIFDKDNNMVENMVKKVFESKRQISYLKK